MGQAASHSFAAPPYVVTVDELVTHWVGRDAELREQHERSRSRSGSRQRRRSSGGFVVVGGGALAVLAEPQEEEEGGNEDQEEAASSVVMARARGPSSALPPPAVTFVTVRRRGGLEVVVCRDVAYGGRIPLPPLLEDEEVIVAFSDGSTARLPARAVRAQAGMGEALYSLEQQEQEQEQELQHGHHQLVCRVEARGEEQQQQQQQLVQRDATGGAAVRLPLQLAGEREVQLAVVLVNMACHHGDLTGVTLLLLGLLLFAEAYKRVQAQLAQGLGGGGRRGEGPLALQAAAAGLELVAERCMARRRSSVAAAMDQQQQQQQQQQQPRTRTMTMTTTLSTTTTITTTTTTVVEFQEEGEDGAAAGGGITTAASATATAAALLVVVEEQEQEQDQQHEQPLQVQTRRASAASLVLLLPEPRVPERYLMVCNHDPLKAQAMLQATLQWRAAYGADEILEQPHTKFHTIKAHFPHFLAGRSKSGFPVYYEQTGRIDQAAMRAAKISVDDMVYNYIYLNEWLYTRLVTDVEAQIITVVDVGGLSMGGLSAQSLEFISKALGLVQAHYPARAQVILLVNAPSWFSWIWGYIKGVADAHTSKTLRVVSASRTYAALCEYIEPDQIPIEYGGTLQYPAAAAAAAAEEEEEEGPLAAARRAQPHSVRWTSPFEREIRAHVDRVRVLAGGGPKEAAEAAGAAAGGTVGAA